MMYVEGLSVNFRKQSLEAVLEKKVFLKSRQSSWNFPKNEFTHRSFSRILLGF